MSLVAIIESGGANYASIQSALKYVGADCVVTRDPHVIRTASQVMLPGVGSAAYAMQLLRDSGLITMLPSLQQPVLGICLGHQLLCAHSAEGEVDCLGIMPIQVERLTDVRIIPHMGWNTVDLQREVALTAGLGDHMDYYFVHGYAPACLSPYTVGTCDYGKPFSAILQKDNFWGVQFHPEKSGEAGLALLKNFVRLS